MTQPFGPSQLDGYDFTRIKAFSDQYYLSSPDTASSGDTIVYNSGTGNWEAKNLVRGFSAYHHAGGTSIGSASAIDLAYDKEIQKDAGYGHTIGTSGVTISISGLYLIQADIAFTVTAGTTVSYVTCWLSKNSTEIEGTRAVAYTPTNGARNNCSISRMVSLSAGDVLKVRAQLSASGNTVSTIADTSRLNLLNIGGKTGGNGTGTSSAMGGGIFAFITYP